MDRSRIEAFATKARKLLKAQIAARVELLRKSDSTSIVIENKRAMEALEKQIDEKGLETVVDEVSYTWFNRLCALRYMDAHGFNRPLVVTPQDGNVLPEILSDAMTGNPDTDILSKSNEDRINKLLTGDVRSNNAQAEIYRILLVSKCNALNKDIPMLFERISDYTDLLLPEDLLSKDAIIPMMREALTDENCETVEVIGWLYQYYISERKDEVFAGFKKGKKATSKEIPAATQLFTPEWIVRYLVENSLGRLWMLNHPDSKLVDKMKYYIKPVDAEPDYIRISSPEEIKICDPCCGSGHMLTYSFDILFEIYSELGYTPKDAAEHIILDNLYGIELDDRAGQLAYFALMMKAREKSRRFFSTGVQPNICVLHNISFTEEEMLEATGLFNRKKDLLITKLLGQYEHADTLGSLITPFLSDIDELKGMLTTETTGDLFAPTDNTIRTRVEDILKFSEFLSKKYHVTVTNPPYMGRANMCSFLSDFAKEEHPDTKSDLFAMFMERCKELTLSHGYYAMVVMQSWMFLSGFENFRVKLIKSSTICSLVHMANMVMHIAFGTAASVFYNGVYPIKGSYCRVEYENLIDDKPTKFPPDNERNQTAPNGTFFEVSSEQFGKIPGSPIAYWASDAILRIFASSSPISSIMKPSQGMATGNNDRFLRKWYEVSLGTTCFTARTQTEAKASLKKWFPITKGGSYRKWYGNNDYLVNWENNGYEIKHYVNEKGKLASRPQNIGCFFSKGLSWSTLSSSELSMRYVSDGFLFETKGSKCHFKNYDYLLYALGILNSCVIDSLLLFIAPTLDFHEGPIGCIPFVNMSIYKDKTDALVKSNIDFSKSDWDSFETSWDFKRFPLLSDKRFSLEDAYTAYRDKANADFYQLKANEEELNRIFIEIYGLQDELKPEEDEKMVSIHRVYDSEEDIPDVMKDSQYALTKKDIVKEFISYAVGCMFGRYSLDVEGLAFAGGEWDSSKYSSFIPDKDNVIPVLSSEWFKDDIVFRFRDFVKVTFGEDSLAENMRFIEDSLGMTIRNYFVKGFYNHHLSTYKNRPIYWLFSSPKGYFNALVYLHRYNENTPSVVLSYLRQMRTKLSTEISALERENSSRNAKTLVNYRKMAEDLDEYERILFPIAMENISLNLDDGVKVNYAKLGKALKKVSALEKSNE